MQPQSNDTTASFAALLRRSDPEIEEVLFTAPHVCLYHMALDSQQWSRKNVEGSLFLYKRRTSPRFQMKVLNKLTTANYVESIHAGMDFEVNSPYLMYTHGNSEIHGIWFYEAEDLTKIGALLNRIKTALPKPDVLPEASSQQQASSSVQPGETNASDSKSDDAAFWDKALTPTKAPPQLAPCPAPAAPSMPSPNNLTKLLQQATLKQQQQQAPAPVPPSQAAAPPLAALPPLLTPSFFQTADRDANLAEMRLAELAQLPPRENPLHRFFPPPSAAAPRPASPPGARQPPPAEPAQKMMSVDGSASIAKLFGKNVATALPPAAPAAAGPPGVAAPKSQEEVRAKLRGAVSRLLANDVFVDMMAAELRTAGLMN